MTYLNLKILVMFLLSVNTLGQVEVRELNEVLIEKVFPVYVMESDFNTTMDSILIKSVVSGQMNYHGESPARDFAEARICDINARGEIVSDFMGQTIPLSKASIFKFKNYLENEEVFSNQYEAFNRLNAVSGQPCGKFIFKVNTYINKWQFRRALKLESESFVYALEDIINPREGILFVYPRFEMDADMRDFIEMSIINNTYKRVLNRDAEEYEIIDTEKDSIDWGYDLQRKLVEDFEYNRAESFEYETFLLVDKNISIDNLVEDFWIKYCLTSEFDYLIFQGRLCEHTNNLAEHVMCDARNSLRQLSTSYHHTTGEKCQIMAHSGYLGEYASKEIESILSNVAEIESMHTSVSAKVLETYKHALKLVKKDGDLYSRFLQNSQNFSKVLKSVNWHHELFDEGYEKYDDYLNNRILEYPSREIPRMDPGWIDPMNPMDLYRVNIPTSNSAGDGLIY